MNNHHHRTVSSLDALLDLEADQIESRIVAMTTADKTLLVQAVEGRATVARDQVGMQRVIARDDHPHQPLVMSGS